MFSATYRNPRLVALILLVVVSAGLSALLSLGRQEDPTITNITAVITTPFPGADPARVEALVTEKIEEELRSIPEIDIITSTSSTGISVVQVDLLETVDPARIEEIWTDTRAALDDAVRNFPPGVPASEFDSDSFGAYGAIVALRPNDASLPLSITGRYAEGLADVLRSVPGTKNAEVYGEPEEEVLVILDPARTAALGLTPDVVAQRVSAADAKVQAGRLLGSGTDVLLEVEGEIRALDRLRDVIVQEHPDGRVTRLGEIAEITRGPRSPAAARALTDGSEAVLVAARLEDGLQVDVWMDRLKEALGDYQADLPAALNAELIFDQSLYTADRLSDVARNMAIGVALVVGVLLLTLGVRAAMIVAMVLPLVSLATLASMNFIGLPLHQMSVTGLIVALGLLVDAAIVMTDEIRQRLRSGMAREKAVGAAVRRLWAPLLASTVTTALSFMPMILLPGPAGDFLGSIAIAVVLMLGWSLVIALTVTPAIAGWMLPEGERAGGLTNGVPAGALGRLFRATVLWGIRNPVRSVMLALILPVTGFLAAGGLTQQFFPGVERDQFHIEVEMPEGTALDRTRAEVLVMDNVLRETPGIRHVAWTIGENAPAFYYNIIGSRENAPAFAHALVTTDSPEATAELLTPLQVRFDRDFPDARVLVRELVQGPPVEAPIELRLVGPDLAELSRLGEEVRKLLMDLDPVTTVRSQIEGGAPKISVDVDEAAANLAGLTLGDVAGQLQAGLDGVTGGSLIEATEELPVRIRLGDEVRGDLDRIANLTLVPAAGPQLAAEGRFPGVPLSAIADIRMEPAAAEITRRNGERVNTIQAFVRPGVLPEAALQEARAAVAESGFAVPAGFRLEIGGDADARDDTIGNLMAPLGLIVTLSFATVVLTFGSFRLTAVTFVVAFLSAGLSLFALAIFNYPFGVTAVIGVIGSIGVSINAAIIILTGLKADPASRSGDPEAMTDVVMGTSRHILSTTVTTFGGFLPLILGGGGFWPPFAMSVAGGVLLSSVISFYFTPQMFALVYARRGGRTKACRPVDRSRPTDPAGPSDPVPTLHHRLAAE
ncbi:MAG: efflux RND transporter permease subunit [Pseudomonadota bacterium]